MTMLSKRRSFSIAGLVATLAVALLCGLPATAYAQYSEPPAVELSTDQGLYWQFEPVLLETRLTNTSDETQEYGPIGLLISPMRYRVFNPSGEEVYLHMVYQDLTGGWWNTSYAPGEIKENIFNLLVWYPIGKQTGTYTVEAGFPVAPGAEDYKTTRTTFEVRPPQGVSDSLVARLGRAKRKIYNQQVGAIRPDTTITEALEQVLSSNAPSYMKELAQFLKGMRIAAMGKLPPSEAGRADSLHAIFLDRYPNSVYAPLARGGYITSAVHKELSAGGGEGDLALDLPAALTVAAGQAFGAFAGDAFRLDGRPHDLEGQLLDEGDARFGLAATTEAAREGLLRTLRGYQEDNLVGQGDAPSVAAPAELPFDADSLASVATEQATETLSPVATGAYGTAEIPVVAHAPQGLTLSSTLEGHGVLVVDGPVMVSGELRWTGLVILRGTPTLTVSGTVESVGALVMVGSPASVQVSNELLVKYSPAALEEAGTLLQE